MSEETAGPGECAGGEGAAVTPTGDPPPVQSPSVVALLSTHGQATVGELGELAAAVTQPEESDDLIEAAGARDVEEVTGWVVSRDRPNGRCRTLHLCGGAGCWRRPGVHFAFYEAFGDAEPDVGTYTRRCRDCFAIIKKLEDLAEVAVDPEQAVATEEESSSSDESLDAGPGAAVGGGGASGDAAAASTDT